MFVKYTLGPNIDSKNLEFPPKLQSRYSQSLQTIGFVKTGSLKTCMKEKTFQPIIDNDNTKLESCPKLRVSLDKEYWFC